MTLSRFVLHTELGNFELIRHGTIFLEKRVLVPQMVPGGRGLPLGILVGGVPPGSPNPESPSDQKDVIFHTRFQTRPLKSIPVFRPGL